MTSTVRIYGKEQISATSFIVADDVDADVTVPMGAGLGATLLKFQLRFLPAEPGGTPGASSWENVEGVVKFTFRGWTAPAGAFLEPFRIGDVGGLGLFVQLSHFRVGTVNHVNWFVLRGGA